MNCELCHHGQRRRMKIYLQVKYYEAFNFYFAKPINEIIAQVPHAQHVIYFKDYLILDEQQEYMKRQRVNLLRFYTKDEIKPRIDILTEFYVQNYKQMHPNVIVTDAYKIMNKRHSKYDKLYYKKVEEKSNEQFVSKQMLNSKLTANSQISFETEEHNIYEDNSKQYPKQQIDFKGLNIIQNLRQLTISQLNMQDHEASIILNECVAQVNQQFVKKPLKRRAQDPKDIKKIINSKSESKKKDQPIELNSGIDQFNDVDIKPKLNRMQSDSQTIQKMLREYQNLQKIRQLRSAISSEMLPVSTSVQGFQGQQKSIRQDHNNNGSMHSSTSTKQETLKKVYQTLPKKITTNQLDKIAKGGCLTDRAYKKPPPISEDLMLKIHDQMKGLSSGDNKQKVEFKYMIPSQYNAQQVHKTTKAKSSNSKKIISELGTKSQHVAPNQKKNTDEIVKKYIQFASSTINKKFDFKLNLQGLNSYGVQEEAQEEEVFSLKPAKETISLRKGIVKFRIKNNSILIEKFYQNEIFAAIQYQIMQKDITSFFKSNKKAIPVSDDIPEKPIVDENLLPVPRPSQQPESKSKQIEINTRGTMLFNELVEVFEKISQIKGQNSKETIKEIVAKVFQQIMKNNPEELLPVYLFTILKLGPDYEQWELGIGQGIIIKTISFVSGKSEKQIRDLQNTLGDLGLAAEQSKSNQTYINKYFQPQKAKEPENLTMMHVFTTLQHMQKVEGTGSSLEKERILTSILRQAKPLEAKYIVRFLEKNLKIGAAEKTMQSALARAFQLFNKFSNDCEGYINQALCECPNYKKIIDTLFQIRDIKELQEHCHITPGIPCKPMLAKPMKSIQMIFQRFENMKFTCEYKYDGLRGQIHYTNGTVSIFSRNLENMTSAYPDIVNFVTTNCQHLDNFIIDSEIVAFDVNTKRILPFQTLSSRAKKNVNQSQIEIQVCLYIFDLLYLNNKSYLSETLQTRRNILRNTFVEQEGKLAFASSRDSENFEEIEEFLLNSIKIGCEGLMIKTLEVNSQYEPSKRSFNWLKLKKDYLDNGLSDTFDLVPIGALFGTGKRKGLYGSYLLACYNEDMDQYETTCKIGTGFSDENLEKFFAHFQEYLIPHPLQEYKCDGVTMDVWFRPSVVWEIKSADIQISPIYSACSTIVQQNGKGVGLRFPRLIKVREDKRPNEATSSQFLYDVYKQQAVIVQNQNHTFDQDDDFY